MKLSVFILFSFLCFFGKAQVTGNVQNKKGEKIEFATIYNLTRKTSCITNANGLFQLQGNEGDSVIIQHLNYEPKSFTIKLKNNTYILTEKNIQLESINISPSIVVDLLKKSCQNTFEKLSKTSLSRVYFDYTLLKNEDTAHIVNLDLDVIHRKRKNMEDGENFKSYIVKKHVMLDSAKTGNMFFSNYIGRPLNLFIRNNLTKGFNIVKTEDSLNIIIQCSLKKSVSDSIMNWEVLIDKKDTCLHKISMITTLSYKNKKGTILTGNTSSYQFVNYISKNNKYYLDEVINKTSFQNLKNDSIFYTASFQYKTYQIVENEERREKGKYIPNNFFISKKYKN
jgi:hypothetical protein